MLRLYLETMEGVLGDVEMFLMDAPNGSSQGLVPYLPLNELQQRRPAPNSQPLRRSSTSMPAMGLRPSAWNSIPASGISTT